MRTVTKSNPEREFFSLMSKRRKYTYMCSYFASFSSEQEHFTLGMYMTTLIRPSDVTKSNRSCSMKEKMAKFSAQYRLLHRASSFEYTMSVHAVHAGAERKVCYIVVYTETPQITTNPSQTLLPVYKLAHLPLPHSKSSPPRTHSL